MSTPDFLTAVVRHMVNVLVTATRMALLAYVSFLHQFPQVLNVLLTLLLVYVAYKLFRRFVNFWIGLAVTVLKTMLVLLLVFVGTAVYVRGLNKFVHSDLPSLVKYFRGRPVDDFKLSYKFAEKVSSSNFDDLKNAWNIVQENVDMDHLAENAEQILSEGQKYFNLYFNNQA